MQPLLRMAGRTFRFLFAGHVVALLLLVQPGRAIDLSLQVRMAMATPHPPLYPPSDVLGQRTLEDALHTDRIVHEGLPTLSLNATHQKDLTGMKCKGLTDYLKKLDKRYETLKVESATAQFSATKTNARHVEHGRVTDKYMVMEKHWDADKLSEELSGISLEALRTLEQYGLHCGASDYHCDRFAHELIAKFEDLEVKKKNTESLLVEAGWLEAEAEGVLPPKNTEDAYKARYDEAWRKMEEVWDLEQKVASHVMIKNAACGYRPPLGPWALPTDGCNLDPEDPIMKALLVDDPDEFVRRWRVEIAKQAGIDEGFVEVDITPCLGKFKR